MRPTQRASGESRAGRDLQSAKVKKTVIVTIVTTLIVLNLLTFVAALPETQKVDSGCCATNEALARDFSAYYTAAWRLFHDPSHVYTHGLVNDGGYQTLPQPEAYKYLPSFLLIASPILLLPYQSALTAFDLLQFFLLPLMAVLLYRLVKDKGIEVIVVAVTAVILMPFPFPTPQWSVSVSYYWQWAEGQSKVLETFLLLAALYLAKTDRPRLAGATLALGAFDPRFVVLALPLFLTYTARSAVKRTLAYAAGALVLLNLPLLYPAIGTGFVEMVLTSGVSTPPYYYSFIPIVALSVLMVIDRAEVAGAMRSIWPGAPAQAARRPRT